jgi:hypothetical protein
MERQRIVHPNGILTLLVRGEGGAATLDAWEHRGRVCGIIGIHATVTSRSERDYDSCEYLPAGICRPDASFTNGIEAAGRVLEGDEDAGWELVERWYRVHIEED